MLSINKKSHILYHILEKAKLKVEQILNQKIIVNYKNVFKIIYKFIYLAQ